MSHGHYGYFVNIIISFKIKYNAPGIVALVVDEYWISWSEAGRKEITQRPSQPTKIKTLGDPYRSVAHTALD